MPYVTERWTGGMLTNFQTTRKSIRKMTSIDKMQDGWNLGDIEQARAFVQNSSA